MSSKKEKSQEKSGIFPKVLIILMKEEIVEKTIIFSHFGSVNVVELTYSY